MFPNELDWQPILLAAALTCLAAGLVFYWLRRAPADPAEVERRRRAHLNQVGRIVEGAIMEIQEAEAAAPPVPPKRLFASRPPVNAAPGVGTKILVFYSYSISGVSYETAQDVTGMEERACLERLVSGLPVSVKYDPANPGNSILLADDWSGLH
jgi:hypothetical protein